MHICIHHISPFIYPSVRLPLQLFISLFIFQSAYRSWGGREEGGSRGGEEGGLREGGQREGEIGRIPLRECVYVHLYLYTQWIFVGNSIFR